MNVTKKAQKAILEQGGDLSGRKIRWPQGTKIISNHGGLKIRKLPQGENYIVWDREDKAYCWVKEAI
jgi:hypothetical protein